MQQQQGGCHVRAIGESYRNRRDVTELIDLSRLVDEAGELPGTGLQIVQIKDPFRMPPEEPRHTILQDLTAWTQERRFRREGTAEREQVVFVSTGPMQQEHRRRSRTAAGNKAMHKAQLRWIHLLSSATACSSRSGGSARSISRRLASYIG